LTVKFNWPDLISEIALVKREKKARLREEKMKAKKTQLERKQKKSAPETEADRTRGEKEKIIKAKLTKLITLRNKTQKEVTKLRSESERYQKLLCTNVQDPATTAQNNQRLMEQNYYTMVNSLALKTLNRRIRKVRRCLPSRKQAQGYLTQSNKVVPHIRAYTDNIKPLASNSVTFAAVSPSTGRVSAIASNPMIGTELGNPCLDMVENHEE
jgi:hypothetical protein